MLRYSIRKVKIGRKVCYSIFSDSDLGIEPVKISTPGVAEYDARELSLVSLSQAMKDLYSASQRPKHSNPDRLEDTQRLSFSMSNLDSQDEGLTALVILSRATDEAYGQRDRQEERAEIKQRQINEARRTLG